MNRLREIELKVQAEFAGYLSQNDPLKNNYGGNHQQTEIRITSRGLRLMSLISGLRRITSDDIGRIFFPSKHPSSFFELQCFL